MALILGSPSVYSCPAAVTTSSWTSLQDISTPASSQAPTLNPNTLAVGNTLRLTAAGTWNCTSTPTFGLGFYYGGAAGTALAATGSTALTTGAGGLSNIPWEMKWSGVVTAVGTSGSIIGGGHVTWATSATAYTLFPYGTPAGAVTINTTLGKSIVIGGVCSASSGSNSIVVQQYTIEILV